MPRFKRPKLIRVHRTKARLPGSFRDDEDNLIHGRDVDAVKTEKSRAARMLGARTVGERAADTRMREHGIQVYDVNAGQAQLSELLHRGRGQ